MNTQAFRHIIAALFAAKWVHWENHWHSTGSNSYGDHLLYQRLYESIDGQVDGLMEKWVATGDVSEMESIMDLARKGLALAKSGRSLPHDRSIIVERLVLRAITTFFGKMEGTGTMSLGLNDFLASLHSDHETSSYLLSQRAKQASRQAVDTGVVVEGYQGFTNPSFHEVLQLAQSPESNEGNISTDSESLPPTPEEIVEEEPNSKDLSTLSRLEVV